MTQTAMISRPTELDVGGRTVRATLRLPEGAERATAALPAVMLCETQTLLGLDESDMLDEVARELTEQGLAVIQYEPSIADLTLAGVDSSWAQHRVDEAASVLAWSFDQEPLDRHRIGVLGCGLGALIVASMAGRTDRIDRLCLLAAPAMESAARLVIGEDDSEAAPSGSRSVMTDSFDELDPVVGVLAFERPALLIYGAADGLAAPKCGAVYLEAAAGAASRVQRLIIPRGNHAFSNPGARAACLSHIGGFFADMKSSRRSDKKNGKK